MSQSDLPLSNATPLVVSYGAGVDSTAMLIGMKARGIRPDLVLFADTGSEKPETYEYIDVMQAWLSSADFPRVTVLKRKPVIDGKMGSYSTLEGNCLVNQTLPSLAFGFKGCSMKWKVEPMDAFVRHWAPAIKAWSAGQKVRRAIGYDAGPKDSKRAWSIREDARHEYLYPLRDWGWDRERCIAEIQSAGLPVPAKSACFFCPATQPEELIQLHRTRPELSARIVEMERVAAPALRNITGLWGAGTKGTRGGRPRPGSMTEFLRALDMGELLPDGTPITRGRFPWDGRPEEQKPEPPKAKQLALFGQADH